MENPGVYELAALQIGAAKPSSLLTPLINLDGMSAVALEAAFLWGSGGTAVTAVVCTSFDKGTTWRQVARFDFATASATKTANLSGLTSRGVASYADLSAEGVLDGILGDRLAVLLTSTGTYSGSVLSVRASVR